METAAGDWKVTVDLLGFFFFLDLEVFRMGSGTLNTVSSSDLEKDLGLIFSSWEVEQVDPG